MKEYKPYEDHRLYPSPDFYPGGAYNTNWGSVHLGELCQNCGYPFAIHPTKDGNHYCLTETDYFSYGLYINKWPAIKQKPILKVKLL